MSQIAKEFLARCFSPGETIALLLRKERPVSTQQRVVVLEKVLAAPYLAWLAHENHSGANIYVAANPLRSGSRKRTKESIARVRHLYLDIDAEGDTRLAALRASNAIPNPTAILSTSPGKYQVLWRVHGFDVVRQEQTLKLLSSAFGGDPACTDCNRVLRIPGFLNRKYNPAYPVAARYPSDSISTPNDFHIDPGAIASTLFADTVPTRKQSGKRSQSEHDWAWVSHELAHGKDAVKLTRELASLRSDKPNPLYYAQRTVDVASARLWLLEGVPIEDVTTMIESHRRFEFPAALCSARAREITQTARRMIARNKIA